jgi:hypothetical protein
VLCVCVVCVCVCVCQLIIVPALSSCLLIATLKLAWAFDESLESPYKNCSPGFLFSLVVVDPGIIEMYNDWVCQRPYLRKNSSHMRKICAYPCPRENACVAIFCGFSGACVCLFCSILVCQALKPQGFRQGFLGSLLKLMGYHDPRIEFRGYFVAYAHAQNPALPPLSPSHAFVATAHATCICAFSRTCECASTLAPVCPTIAHMRPTHKRTRMRMPRHVQNIRTVRTTTGMPWRAHVRYRHHACAPTRTHAQAHAHAGAQTHTYKREHCARPSTRMCRNAHTRARHRDCRRHAALSLCAQPPIKHACAFTQKPCAQPHDGQLLYSVHY